MSASFSADLLGRNFSRPFPTPTLIQESAFFPGINLLQYATRSNIFEDDTADSMANDKFDNPTKAPRAKYRYAFTELTLSSSRLNPTHLVGDDLKEAPALAAKRPPGADWATPPRILNTTAPSSFNKQLYKPTRVPFSRPSSEVLYAVAALSAIDDRATTDSDSTITDGTHHDLGGPSAPILHFRPQLWKHLERNRRTLNIDLFRPMNMDDDLEEEDPEDIGPEVFPLRDLKPLCEFHHLRSLQLNGMLQSYQKYIWQTCWLNPGLEELVLEMALEPTVPEHYKNMWPAIDGAWQMKGEHFASVEYRGDHGQGSLAESYGIGEYLDKQAISLMKMEASPLGGHRRYLPVVKLVLSGFVVDAGPFFRWFNPMRLRHVDFKENCIDAGFALPANMKNTVTVSWPGAPKENKMVKITKVERKDVQTISLKEGRKVPESFGLKRKISQMLSYRWLMTNRRDSSQDHLFGDRSSPRQLRSSDSLSQLRPRSGQGEASDRRLNAGRSQTSESIPQLRPRNSGQGDPVDRRWSAGRLRASDSLSQLRPINSGQEEVFDKRWSAGRLRHSDSLSQLFRRQRPISETSAMIPDLAML